MRNVVLKSPDALDRPDIAALIEAALSLAAIPMAASEGQRVIVRSISAKQRPRR